MSESLISLNEKNTDDAGIPGRREAPRKETFPNAEISENKGFVGSKGRLIVLAILLFLACGLPVIGFIVGNLGK